MTSWARTSIVGLGVAGLLLFGMLLAPQRAAAQPDSGYVLVGDATSNTLTFEPRTRGFLDAAPVNPPAASDPVVLEVKTTKPSAEAPPPSKPVTNVASATKTVTSSIQLSSEAGVDSTNAFSTHSGSVFYGDTCLLTPADGVQGSDRTGIDALIPDVVESGTATLGESNNLVPASQANRFRVADCTLPGLNVSRGDSVSIMWKVRMKFLSQTGDPIQGAMVRIANALGTAIDPVRTDFDGLTPPLSLVEKLVKKDGTTIMNPYTVIVETGGIAQQFEMTVDSNRFFTFVIQVPLDGPPLLLSLNVAVALLGLFFASSLSIERSRLALLSPFIPLYTRVRREDIVGQHTRGIILAFLDTNPGEHFGAIKRALALTNGNAMYHLRFLEKEGLVKTRFDGMLKRYYPRWMNVPEEENGRLLEVQQHA